VVDLEGVHLGVENDVLEEAVDAPLLVDVVGGAEGDPLGELERRTASPVTRGLNLRPWAARSW
jgi:hypothetical protein